MGFLQTFGLKKTIPGGQKTTASVTDVKTCWWLKVNTKPVRTHMWDGAVYPHIITYAYTVDGTAYTGRRFIWVTDRCPKPTEQIPVLYDPRQPNHSLYSPK